ncbi:hypothetical protein MMPV_007735 [Pyropia vietnamensis]
MVAGVVSLTPPTSGHNTSLAPLPTPLLIPNALTRPPRYNSSSRAPRSSPRPPGYLVGAEIAALRDLSGLRLVRPVERGIVTRWDTQADVWASVLSADAGLGGELAGVGRREVGVLVTEPLGNLLHCRRAMDELVFEWGGFGALLATVSPPLLLRSTRGSSGAPASAVDEALGTGLVIDAGFSFTTATPVVRGTPLLPACRRVDVGGKALTNYLKACLSRGAYALHDETLLVEAIKERTCYVTPSFAAAAAAPRPPAAHYLLPAYTDPAADPRGRRLAHRSDAPPGEAALSVGRERFTVPELLFAPGDLGAPTGGLVDAVAAAVAAAPATTAARLWANVVVGGGGARLPGFLPRLAAELRSVAPAAMRVRVRAAGGGVGVGGEIPSAEGGEGMTTAAWYGAAATVADAVGGRRVVTGHTVWLPAPSMRSRVTE